MHEKCSVSLIIREMQIKTALRYHLTLARMAVIKSLQIKNVGETVEEREPLYIVGGFELVQQPWKTEWRLPTKLKPELPYDPEIPLLGVYIPKKKAQVPKDTLTPMFIAALFTIAKKWKQPKNPSADEWIKKMWYI